MANQFVTLSNGKVIPIVNPKADLDIPSRGDNGKYKRPPKFLPHAFTAKLGTSSSFNYVYAKNGEVYALGYAAGLAQYNSGMMAKYAADGTVIWSKTLMERNSIWRAVASDSEGNLYAVASASVLNGNTGVKTLLLKFTPEGTLLWQRLLGDTRNSPSLSYSVTPLDIAVDEAGACYISASYANDNGGDILVMKVNSGGSFVWRAAIGGQYAESCSSLVVKDGSVYLAGYTASAINVPNAITGGVYFRLNAETGVRQVQRAYGVSSSAQSSLSFQSVSVLSDGSKILSGNSRITSLSKNRMVIVKLNSSDNLEWVRSFEQSGNGRHCMDSQENIYILSSATAGSAGLTKLAPTGEILWQRLISCSSKLTLGGIAVDSSGYVHLAGSTDALTGAEIEAVTLSFLSDGSGLGAYGPFSYSENSLVEATGHAQLSSGSINSFAATNPSIGNVSYTLSGVTDASPAISVIA